MLRVLIFAGMIGVFAFAFGVLGLSAWRSFQQNEQTNQEASAEKPTKKGSQTTLFVATKESTDEAIARYNLWLMIFTGVLAIVAIIQIGFLISADKIASEAAGAAKQAADTAKNSLITTQRAFVFIKQFHPTFIGDTLYITPEWENSGSTPTKIMRNYINWSASPGEITQFPDLDGSGRPLSGPAEGIALFVGPRATILGQKISIKTDMLEQLRKKETRFFIWGWAYYEDVFGNPHRTEFCNEVVIVPIKDGPPGSREIAVTLPIYRLHNSAN